MDVALIQQDKHGIMDDDDDNDEESLGSSSSLSQVSLSTLSEEFTEDTASSSSSSSSSSSPPSCKGPLFEMSSLKEQLPSKRGLSKFFRGRSQSFASFSDIRCLEDLAKPERPMKRLKTSKSCGDGFGIDSKRSSLSLKCCNKRAITKKGSKGSFSASDSARRNCLLGSKPPLYPQGPSNIFNHTLWFA